MRSFLGWLFLVAAALSLVPFLPQAWAYVNGQVNLPSGSPARYRTATATSGTFLLECTIPKQITLKEGTPRSGLYFRCINNFNGVVTLEWQVVDDGTPGNTFLQIDGVQTSDLSPGAGAACMTLTLDPQLTRDTRTVYFRGVTSSSSPFYAEIYFSRSVKIQAGNGGVGDSCP